MSSFDFCSAGFDNLFIGISGLIGAGKSTLATALAKEMGLPVHYEPVIDNVYLEDFYGDMKKYAFQLQSTPPPRCARERLGGFGLPPFRAPPFRAPPPPPPPPPPRPVYLLNKRFKQQQQIIWEGKGGVVDRTIYEDSVFAKMLRNGGLLDERDYNTYCELFSHMSNFMKKPNVIVHLDVSPEESLRRIKMRSRDCESKVTLE
jgi:deoxyadenosine kinase